jgi:hypothetical protein
MRFDAVNRRVHSTIHDLAHQGASAEDMANILFAYALNIAYDTQGRAAVADRLRRLTEAFESGAGKNFAEIAELIPTPRDPSPSRARERRAA